MVFNTKLRILDADISSSLNTLHYFKQTLKCITLYTNGAGELQLKPANLREPSKESIYFFSN